MIYEYLCGVCKVEMKQLGRTCPECKKRRIDKIPPRSRDEKRMHRKMDDWWNNLSEANQQKAFFSVVKRLNEAECIEELSFLETLSDKFGFGPKSHYMGLQCGFMNLHNSIATEEELFEMRIARSEPFAPPE